MKAICIVIALSILAMSPRAQVNEEPLPERPKRVGFAVGELMLSNALVWTYDRYFREDNYSFLISWRTVEANLRHGFEWDPNKFGVNFFAHPYHGNIYFNTARTNGFSFWESAPFAFFGSLMWETCWESEYPAYNDLLATTVGGISLGETFFRFSEQVLDDRARGGERAWREALGFALNPVGGINRVIHGDMWRRSSNVNHLRQPLTGWAALGVGGRIKDNGSDVRDLSGAIEMTMFYGRPFAPKKRRLPFDYIAVRFVTSKGDTTRNIIVMAQGTLLGREFGGKGTQRHYLSLFQHFDFLDNELFKLGSMATGVGLMSRFPIGADMTLFTSPYLGFMILGAGSNEYVLSYQGRNYNFGRGLKGSIETLLTHPRYGSLQLDYYHFAIYAREGAPGTDRLNLVHTAYRVPVWRSLGVGAEYTYYHRNARYDEFPDVKRSINSFRWLVSYSIR